MKYCIITGANSGIGRSAAFQIAERGSALILACRNLEAAQKTCNEIKAKTGNENVYVMKVDLSLMSDVHSFITEYKRKYDRLDVLINNAADFDISRKEPKITNECNEAQFATNVLAPHLLSIGLMDLLEKSEDGRIINISSKGLVMYPNIKLDYENLRAQKYYKPSKTYYQNKLALLMLSLKLRENLKNTRVSVFAIRVTNVKIDLNRYKNVSPVLKTIYKLKSKKSISPDEMAKVYTELALDKLKKGFYYDENVEEVPVTKFALIKEEQEKIWKLVNEKI